MDHDSTPASVTDFPYPPLPLEDAIRILTIEPGDFDDEITSTLTPVTFGARPKYTALSYTWGDSYPDTAALPTAPDRGSSTQQSASSYIPEPPSKASNLKIHDNADFIIVNNYRFPVRHNLSLALRHLRSPIYPLLLWVDAICINQKNTKELNVHVAKMSFIYRRAFMVVAWLGVREYKACLDIFRFMRREWGSGQTQHLAEYVGGSTRIRFSYEPDEGTFARIATSSYWTRLWIVQEVCLPQQLVFVLGSKIWTCEDLRRWKTLEAAKTNPSRSKDDQCLGMGLENMIRLLDARESKHTEDMSLGNLLETFSKAACSEIRDRIYGLLGLANDVTPYSSADGDIDPIDKLIEFLGSQDEPLPAPPRGRGRFKVDYSQSFYEVWAEVLKYVYFRAKWVGGKHARQVLDATLDLDLLIGGDTLIEQERHLNIVRTSGVVQEALKQMIEEERIKSNGVKTIYQNLVIRALGYISGEVLEIGPMYTDLISSSRSEEEWLSCFEHYYSNPDDLEVLRRTDERYMTKILGYGDKELSRIRGIKNPRVIAWGFTEQRPQCSNSIYAAEYEKIWEDGERKQNHATEQMMCLCTGHQIGIVPSTAKRGDVLIRFFDCSAAIIMRPRTENQQTSFMLVGRADAAEVAYRNTAEETTPRRDVHAMNGLSGNLSPNYAKGSQAPGAVYVDLDLDTLQLITASVATGK
ncbi:heterokaryon incompatibility protein-domain-containing protein [Hypoxylon cercidicola]|nr:heterokaryon incompatibility protein-domain-containing protein [Hypoxylon cercidicola]